MRLSAVATVFRIKARTLMATKTGIAKRKLDFNELRRAVADYMYSEGCSCCRDIDAHTNALVRLAEMLDIPKFSDGSGFDFYKFRTREVPRGKR